MTNQPFNSEDFAKNLAQEATQVIPKDLNLEQKKYIINKVYQFCVLAGNAVIQDQSLNLKDEQIYIIVQFVGEWTFHKSIDIIRAQVPPDCWDAILQQIAFAVFEVARNSQVNNIEQDKAIDLVEKEVKAAFEKAITELSEAGQVEKEKVSAILKQSNLEQMSQAPPTPTKEEQEKSLKIASLALLLRTMKEEKVQKILNNLEKEQADLIIRFMQVQDLEKKLDPNIAGTFLTSLKKIISNNKEEAEESIPNPFKKLKTIYNEEDFINIIKFERPKIKNYVEYCVKSKKTGNNTEFEVSPQVSKIIYSYVKSKLAKKEALSAN